MVWVRIDDGFTSNGKVSQLTDAEFRVWMRVLCHCGKAQDPTVDGVTKREVAGLSTARVKRFAELRLLDTVGDDFQVHDWDQYQPKDATNAERQARWRANQRYARNGKGNATTVTPPVTPLARTRVPVPSPVIPKAVVLDAEHTGDRTASGFQLPEDLLEPMP